MVIAAKHGSSEITEHSFDFMGEWYAQRILARLWIDSYYRFQDDCFALTPD